MVSISSAQYRGWVAATIALYLATLAMVELHLVSYSHAMEVAHSWNGYGAILPYPVRLSWSLALPLLFLAALTGLLFFRAWARWVATAALLAQVVCDPFAGLLVLTPIEHFLGSLVGTMTCLVVSLAIFSPLATEFGARPDAPPLPSR